MNVTYLLWRRNTNVLPWVSRWPWPNTSKVLRGLTGVLGFCDGISCPSGNISISFKKCIWKAQGLITSCSPVTQHRGGDNHKSSFGGASRWEQPTAEQVSRVALPLANRVIVSAFEKRARTHTQAEILRLLCTKRNMSACLWKTILIIHCT